MKTSIISKLLIFSLLICFSCKKINTDYVYFDSFSTYLNEVHDIEINTTNTIFFLLPVNGCDNCIKLNIELLNSTTYDIQLILIGETFDPTRISTLNKLKDRYQNILFDTKSVISQFRTGFSKPMIVSVTNGNCTYHLDVSDFKIDEAREYLKNKISD